MSTVELLPPIQPQSNLVFGFRRRCGWCGVPLRLWQLHLCQRCKRSVVLDLPSPWCAHASRWGAAADRKPRPFSRQEQV